MDIIFNDILSSSSTPVEATGEMKFISSGLIFEKQVKTAQVYKTVQELFDAYSKLTSQAERDKLEESADAEHILNDPKNRKEFYRKVKSLGTPQSGKTGDVVSDVAQLGIDEAELAGVPASKFAPFMEMKDQIIQKLRPFMSEAKIGGVFNELLEEVKLPYTEVIGALDFLISQARSCNAEVDKVIDFFISHYKQKRQYTLVKELIKNACELQKLNPVVDIFAVLKDAISGNQPQVGLMYALKDPDAMKAFNELVMLSQSNLPEQSEEIRRRFQSSRDALNNQQQKFNMQRALVDMMKIEETNKQLVGMIKNMGTAFEFLMTQPMYRALRDMLYDLRAGKVIMNQAASIFGGDRSPETKRSTPQEQSTLRENTFPGIGEERQPFADSNLKFVKLASPEVQRYIYSQTAPQQANQSPILSAFQQIMNKIVEVKDNVVREIQKYAGAVGKVVEFFTKLYNAFKILFEKLRAGNISPDAVEQAFAPLLTSLVSASSEKNLRLAQRAPQQPTRTRPNTAQILNDALKIIASVGTTIAGGILAYHSAASLLAAGDIGSILNSIAPLLLMLKNNVMEILVEFPGFGKNAPISSQFFNANGTLSNQGKQALVNAKETMISLGISDADAMALSKFDVEKEYLMSFLNKKEQNLRDFETQVVQTGSGTTESTVGGIPQDYQTKIKEFLGFCNDLESKFKANLNLFRNGLENAKKQFNQAQLTHIQGKLSEYQADLLAIQKKKAEYSSLKNIAANMMRKRIIFQKLKPLQTQMDTLKKLGIPIANAIASPNGILAMSGAIRKEVSDALVALRKEHEELSQLIKNPDKAAQLVKYPTDVNLTKLPESPDQSASTESPFGNESTPEVRNV